MTMPADRNTTRPTEGVNGTAAPASQLPVFTGDNTGAFITYVCRKDDRLIRSHDLRDLLRKSSKDRLEVDEISLSHLLHDGFVPFPRTIFKGVHALGIGDQIALSGVGGKLKLQFTVEFPFLSHRSAKDQTPDPDWLLQLLCASLERGLEGQGNATLMLSSGLDSVPIALAAAEIGRAANVTALTFDQHGSGEGAAAATFARRFGLRHTAVGFPREPRDVAEMVVDFFSKADQPCCDPVTLAYVATLRQREVSAPLVLDGSGSDIYLGEVITRRARLLDRQRGLPVGWIGAVRELAPFWSPLNKVASSRCEKTFVNEYRLRHQETRHFFTGSVDTSIWWLEQDRKLTSYNFTDLDTLVGGRHHDANCSMLKARLAAGIQAAQAVFPWCDADIIAYCFNLPDSYRRGNRSEGNKPLVRRMLQKYADYDAVTQSRKAIFSFVLTEFLLNNRPLIENEVLSCPLWSSSVHETMNMLWQTLTARRGTAIALHTLFAISAWLNHASILKQLGGDPQAQAALHVTSDGRSAAPDGYPHVYSTLT